MSNPGSGSRPKQLRLLWRMQGPRDVIVAALYNHSDGIELRVYVEPDRDDLVQSEVHAFDVFALELKANALRDILRDKGWWELRDAQ